MEQITINNISINIIRKDIKNIHLAVYPPAGSVRLSAPIRANEDAIRLFIISKLGWIKRNQRKYIDQERLSPREFKYRESHYLFGRRYLLNIIETDSKSGIILQNKKDIELHIKPGTPLSKRQNIMNKWYREQLKALIPDLIQKWEEKINITVSKWQIKQMKTKWGSCNIDDKRIWLNLELAKKPVQCIEYILVHEMIHLKERHHNKQFQYYLDTFLPNWKKLKAELNRLPVSHAEWKY